MPAALVILCTCPDRETAARLAGSLVESGLAACVNILPSIRSIYSWQGEVQEDEETLLVIKTLESAYEAVKAHLLSEHPYDVPEVVAIPAERVSEDYLAWIESSVQR